MLRPIQSAQAFVFLIGPPGFDDRWQTFEWQQVVDREFYLDPAKPLIPIVIGNPEIPGFLKTRQSVALEDTPGSYERAVDLIVNALYNPAISVDERKLALALKARRRALEDLREYSEALGQEAISGWLTPQPDYSPPSPSPRAILEVRDWSNY